MFEEKDRTAFDRPDEEPVFGAKIEPRPETAKGDGRFPCAQTSFDWFAVGGLPG